MEKLKVIELINDLSIPDGAEYISDYTGNIEEALHEMADSNVNIYNYDLWNWARDNQSAVEDYVAEFGIDEKNFDLIRLFMGAQYMEIYNEYLRNEDDVIAFYALNSIMKDYKQEEITIEQWEFIQDGLRSIDYNNHLEDIDEIVRNLFEEEGA